MDEWSLDCQCATKTANPKSKFRSTILVSFFNGPLPSKPKQKWKYSLFKKMFLLKKVQESWLSFNRVRDQTFLILKPMFNFEKIVLSLIPLIFWSKHFFLSLGFEPWVAAPVKIVYDCSARALFSRRRWTTVSSQALIVAQQKNWCSITNICFFCFF